MSIAVDTKIKDIVIAYIRKNGIKKITISKND